MRILVVDDHQVVRRGVCGLLEGENGLEVCGEAVDGREAIAKAQELKPDAVVMDVSMPVMNGLEATREISRLLPEIRIVILSQHDAPEMMRQALKAGAHAYVVKSAVSTELVAVLDKIQRGERSSLPVVLGSEGTNVDVKELLQRSTAFETALRQTEQRLRNVVEYQSAVMNNMAEGLYTLDANGAVTSLNPAGEEILGWKCEELLGRKMHDATHYKHQDGSPFPASECPGLQVLQKGIALREHEDCFLHKDGSFVPVVFSASPLREDGKIAGVIVSFRDDTDHRRAQNALLEAKRELEMTARHLQLVTNTMAASVTRCNRDFKYMWANQGYADWLQQPLDKIIGRSISEVLGSEAFENLLPRFRRVLAGETVSYEEEIPFRSIGRRWISAVYTPTLDAMGAPDGWVAIIWDVTGRKSNEGALRESEARLAEEACALAKLNDLSSRLWSIRDLQQGLDEMLASVIDLLGAQKGNIQLLDTKKGVLTIAAQCGLDQEFLDYFREVSTEDNSACGRALRTGRRIVIEDVDADVAYAPMRPIARAAGYRAVTSTPLMAFDGTAFGMVSTHFRTVHRPNEEELRRLDLYARQAANFIQCRRIEEQLTEQARLLELSHDAIVVRDEADRIVAWNAGAAETYGFTREEALGRLAHQLLRTSFPELRERILETLHRTGNWSGELVHVGKDGEPISVSSRWALFRSKDGTSLSTLQIDRDISALKQTQAEILKHRSELEQRVEERTSALADANRRLGTLSARLLQAQDDERRRIAQELHDSTGQLLTALGITLFQLEGKLREIAPPLSGALSESQALVQQLTEEIRTTSYLLHPPLLDDLGLGAALELYVNGLRERSDLAIDLKISESFGRVPQETELVVFRTVQEALTNIRRHSASKTAAIRVSRVGNEIHVQIQDQGHGIPKDKLTAIQSGGAGVGIAAMLERVRHLGGKMNIGSNENGTTISLTLQARAASR